MQRIASIDDLWMTFHNWFSDSRPIRGRGVAVTELREGLHNTRKLEECMAGRCSYAAADQAPGHGIT